MCGIAGKVSPGAPVERELLERMCSVIEHRGPDSRGIYLNGDVGLGIQRLRIIDLKTGDQPIFNEDGSVVVVLNGEIYNYVELREELERRGHRFSTHGDTEVIVHLYEDHGAGCVDWLRGMFAFALWDDKQRQLLIARDRLGKKPLFYSVQGPNLWFGSEAKSIIEDPEIDRDVDFDAIDSFLHFSYVPHPLSAFARLRKLPPAHILVWKDGRARIERYWKLSYRRGEAANEAEAHELIREHVLEATRLRLRSDVPVGAFLSGGVDSSAVVAAMAMQGGRVKTFAIGFEDPRYDETRWAAETAKLFDTDHHELRVKSRSALEVLPQLVWHYGEPFADSSAIPSLYLAELTRRHVTVALNGDGGDENFAGYFRHVGKRSDRLLALPRPVLQLLGVVASRVSPDGIEHSLRSRFIRAAAESLMAPDDRYADRLSVFLEREREELYTDEFRSALGDRRTARTVVSTPYLESDATDEVNRLLDVDIQTFLPGDLLVKMDIATMAHSLEVRSPLLDHRLIEMSAGLPGAWKTAGGSTKKIFKDALRPWLPDHLLDRPKWGFAVPIASWFRGELREFVSEILLDRASLERGFFREDGLRRLIDEHTSGENDNSAKLWALIQLELWLRMFVDAGVTRPVAVGFGSS